MTPLTIAYITARQNPRFEWFVWSLRREMRSMPDVDHSTMQVIVIDGKLPRGAGDAHFKRSHAFTDAWCVDGVLELPVRLGFISPKPCAWQGEFRQTSKDYFAAGNARNTALIMANNPHVVFVDDLSALLPGWLKAHYHAAETRKVLAGSTCKNKGVSVTPEGDVAFAQFHAPGQDGRLKLTQAEWSRCSGQWLYGGTFSVPLELALDVNGVDEINDSIGGEDYDFGLRLERAGGEVWFCRTCATIEDEDAHHAEAPMVRLDKPWAGPDGPYSSNKLLNTLMRDSGIIRARGNDFNLRVVREEVRKGGEWPRPPANMRHWVDNQLLSEM